MDIVLMIVYVSIVLGILVLIHEGGHFCAARAFGVRVTEFMIGFPGPGISIKRGETRFGVTIVPLGGYAKVCGMEPGEMSAHIKPVLAALYTRGTATMEDIAHDCHISNDEACEALDELVEWGSITGPTKKDEFNTYRTPEVRPTRAERRRARKASEPEPPAYEAGTPRIVEDAEALFKSEYNQQYRSLPFWKRTVILLAGIAVNLLFAILAFVLVYSIIGFDLQNSQTGEVVHYTLSPVQAIEAGASAIALTVQAVVQLFNPITAPDVVSQSSSIVGIAVYSKAYAEAGIAYFIYFMAIISVSLGVMNLLPIPPLDGGRFVVEIFQRLTRKTVGQRALNALSAAGMALVMLLFVVMVNKDIVSLVTGDFWSS